MLARRSSARRSGESPSTATRLRTGTCARPTFAGPDPERRRRVPLWLQYLALAAAVMAWLAVAAVIYEARDPGDCDTAAACRALVRFGAIADDVHRGVDRAAP